MTLLTKPFYINNIFEGILDSWYDSTTFFPADWDLKIPSVPHNVMVEQDGTLVVEVAAGGVEKKDIKVSAHDNVLSIFVSRTENKKKEGEEVRYIVHKLAQSNIDLEYKLSDKMDLSKTKVELKKGILTVTIPMLEEQKPKSYDFDVNYI